MPKKNINITLAQINCTVGDLEGNYKKITTAYKKSLKNGNGIIIFPELAITGYPPEDLILRPDFQDNTIKIIRKLAAITTNNNAILLGSPWKEGDNLYNAAILLYGGEIKQISCKSDLPNYGVFDEKRIFMPAPISQPMEFLGLKLGVMICEEMWNKETAKHLKKRGAEILISINASPFEIDKVELRKQVALRNVEETSLPLLYVNLIGGQDELVFDGNSFIMNKNGEIKRQLSHCQEDIYPTEWVKIGNKWQIETKKAKLLSNAAHTQISNNGYHLLDTTTKCELTYNILKLGLYDYVTKNGFPGVVMGMSGGIDSAISAAIAADALGNERVRLIMMPSAYTSEESLEDAKLCAKLLKIKLETIDIEQAFEAFKGILKSTFKGTKPNITEENLQSRIRGNILMAISNKFGHMVLTTGNKSEMAVGYATIYGDMCGGFNVLKDIYKTDVYALTKWRNLQNVVVPERILTKAPTAELRPNQTDQDILPPYDILDKILYRLIELKQSSSDIIHSGFSPEIVNKISKMVKFAEYKRRQASPGIKITKLAFGRDRRYPITNFYNM